MNTFNIYQSPIRKNVNSLKDDQLSIFEDRNSKLVKTILHDVENMFRAMKENENNKIRIAVMGEVKAGKSTFINDLVEKEITYTDILEATALITEIIYAPEDYVKLLDKSGKVVKSFTIEEALDWMENMIDSDADFSAYDKFEIGINNDILEDMILVDTPGLESITSRNHNLTNEYVAQADYILWVIDSQNLGSKAVNDYLDRLKLTGKPIIGIINKVDSDDDKAAIENYIENSYNTIFEEIYYISSLNAWDKLQSNDLEWSISTGFDKIYNCIEDLKYDREHSTAKTQFFQLQRDKEVHLQMKERISERKKHYDNEINEFLFANNEIKKAIKDELQSWYDDFFREEKTKLMEVELGQFQTLCEKYRSEDYLKRKFEDKYNEITQFISKKWKIIYEGMGLTSSHIDIDFRYDKQFIYDNNYTDDAQDNVDHFKDEVKKFTGLGLALSGYYAWLGPAAESVTFIEAAFPIVPLLAIGGAIFAGLAKKNIDEKNAEKEKARKEYIDELYQEIKKLASSQTKEILKNMYRYTDLCYTEKLQDFKNAAAMFNFDFTEPAYSQFMNELDEYISNLDTTIQDLGFDSIPLPPEDDSENDTTQGD